MQQKLAREAEAILLDQVVLVPENIEKRRNQSRNILDPRDKLGRLSNRPQDKSDDRFSIGIAQAKDEGAAVSGNPPHHGRELIVPVAGALVCLPADHVANTALGDFAQVDRGVSGKVAVHVIRDGAKLRRSMGDFCVPVRAKAPYEIDFIASKFPGLYAACVILRLDLQGDRDQWSRHRIRICRFFLQLHLLSSLIAHSEDYNLSLQRDDSSSKLFTAFNTAICLDLLRYHSTDMRLSNQLHSQGQHIRLILLIGGGNIIGQIHNRARNIGYHKHTRPGERLGLHTGFAIHLELLLVIGHNFKQFHTHHFNISKILGTLATASKAMKRRTPGKVAARLEDSSARRSGLCKKLFAEPRNASFGCDFGHCEEAD